MFRRTTGGNRAGRRRLREQNRWKQPHPRSRPRSRLAPRLGAFPDVPDDDAAPATSCGLHGALRPAAHRMPSWARQGRYWLISQNNVCKTAGRLGCMNTCLPVLKSTASYGGSRRDGRDVPSQRRRPVRLPLLPAPRPTRRAADRLPSCRGTRGCSRSS